MWRRRVEKGGASVYAYRYIYIYLRAWYICIVPLAHGFHCLHDTWLAAQVRAILRGQLSTLQLGFRYLPDDASLGQPFFNKKCSF